MSDFYPQLGKTGMSRRELLGKIRKRVKAARFQHMLAVEETSGELAEQYGADVSVAKLAGLLHDYAKELSKDEFMTLIDRYHLDRDLKNWSNAIWHGEIGWLKVKEDFPGIQPEILEAIACHTVGRAQMSLLDKIVYVADYIEPGRDFPGVDEARDLAKQSLDQAVAFETAQTVAYLAKQRFPIYPETLATYNAYVKFLRES